MPRKSQGVWGVRGVQGVAGVPGSESVLGTFVLDSPSKVLFSSILMAQLWRQPLQCRLVVVWAAQPSWRLRSEDAPYTGSNTSASAASSQAEGGVRKKWLRLE